jgi:hypothetical protein
LFEAQFGTIIIFLRARQVFSKNNLPRYINFSEHLKAWFATFHKHLKPIPTSEKIT